MLLQFLNYLLTKINQLPVIIFTFDRLLLQSANTRNEYNLRSECQYQYVFSKSLNFLIVDSSNYRENRLALILKEVFANLAVKIC